MDWIGQNWMIGLNVFAIGSIWIGFDWELRVIWYMVRLLIEYDKIILPTKQHMSLFISSATIHISHNQNSQS